MISLQSGVISSILAIMIIYGGVANAVNATNVQDDYVVELECSKLHDFPDNYNITDKICHDFKKLRDSQATSAVSFYAYISIIQIFAWLIRPSKVTNYSEHVQFLVYIRKDILCIT